MAVLLWFWHNIEETVVIMHSRAKVSKVIARLSRSWQVCHKVWWSQTWLLGILSNWILLKSTLWSYKGCHVLRITEGMPWSVSGLESLPLAPTAGYFWSVSRKYYKTLWNSSNWTSKKIHIIITNEAIIYVYRSYRYSKPYHLILNSLNFKGIS